LKEKRVIAKRLTLGIQVGQAKPLIQNHPEAVVVREDLLDLVS
jgi:hypothetical protein